MAPITHSLELLIRGVFVCYDNDMSQKYVLVHFVDVPSAPLEFPMSEWPLHVTLLANFQTNQLDTVRERLNKLVSDAEPFTITADGEAFFGPSQSVHVSLIRPDKNIKALHEKLLELTTELGAIFDEPMYNAAGYRPHATIQRKSRLNDGQAITLDSITLVDMFPNQDIKQRKIIETYSLGTRREAR
jgi:2'-5' RNA ligase